MTTVLHAKKREKGPRSALTQLRAQGQLPAVIYGFEIEATPITLEYKEAEKAYRTHGGAAVFKIDVEGKQVQAIMTDIQRDALKGNVKHLDLLAINMKEALEVEIPFSLVGDAIGVNEGGVLMQPNLTLTIKVKPSNIPETVEVDITDLAVGDTLSLGQVRDKFDFEILNEDHYTLATVTLPSPTELEEDEAEKVADHAESSAEMVDAENSAQHNE